jgi:hypothetical protein
MWNLIYAAGQYQGRGKVGYRAVQAPPPSLEALHLFEAKTGFLNIYYLYEFRARKFNWNDCAVQAICMFKKGKSQRVCLIFKNAFRFKSVIEAHWNELKTKVRCVSEHDAMKRTGLMIQIF